MKANKRLVSLITLILTVALMFSLCSLSVFAETEPAAESATESATESAPQSETESAPESAPESGKESSGTTTGENEEEKDMTATIVSLCILGVIVVAIALFCIIKREKVGKFFRGLKSESKKVVWMPWNQVRKNTIVVIVVVVVVAIIIGGLDIAFSTGIGALGSLL